MSLLQHLRLPVSGCGPISETLWKTFEFFANRESYFCQILLRKQTPLTYHVSHKVHIHHMKMQSSLFFSVIHTHTHTALPDPSMIEVWTPSRLRGVCSKWNTLSRQSRWVSVWDTTYWLLVDCTQCWTAIHVSMNSLARLRLDCRHQRGSF